jgi:preprotein translocase subunit YajC
MSLAESSFIAGIMTFIFYCVIPLGLVLYILSSPARKRQIKEREKAKFLQQQQAVQEDEPNQTKSN